jgi:nucleoside-diphosphate-sugar epimerase
MRVLITGAKGFLGQAIVSELSGGSHDLTIIDRPGTIGTFDASVSFRDLGADITDLDQMRALDVGPIDAVIHAAGLAHQFGSVSKERFRKVNVEGTRNIAELAVRFGARHLILISSVSVYGPAKSALPRTEEAECNPVGNYAESKLESEAEAMMVCEQNGVDLTILRLATVIGEGDRGNVFRLIRAVAKGRFLWIGKGENQKSLVYKGDAARACAAILKSPGNGTRVYNVSAAPAAMKEIVSYIEKALNKKAPGLSVPASFLRTVFRVNSLTLGIKKIERISASVEKWLAEDSYSAGKLHSEVGFLPEVTLEEAIAREAGWYQENK